MNLMKRFLICVLPIIMFSSVAFAQKPIWKRSFILSKDLARALELTEAELCYEDQVYSCFDFVHQYALGGHEPFERGEYQGQSSPSLTTAVAVDRVVLSSCTNRLKKDRLLPATQRYFNVWEASESVQKIAKQDVDLMVKKLYHKFFARDPSIHEVQILHDLYLSKPMQESDGFELARMLCFVIGTQTEFLFY